VSPQELRRRRAAAQRLSAGGGTPEEIVGHLLAVQAQDLRSARLALRARSEGLVAADVDRALNEGTLVVGWLMRGTLHLVRREDYPWLLALTAPTRLAANRRRLEQEGVSARDAERAVAIVEGALSDEGSLTRGELAERIAAEGIRTAGQAMPHLLMLAALRGVAVRGAEAFVLSRPTEVDREAALAELARRYLASHAPALETDLARWAGLPLADVRAGLRGVAPAEVEADRPPPRLLPAFDPYLLGWQDRSFAVPAEHARRVRPGGGIVRAVATDGGLAVGTWSARRHRGRLTVGVQPFDDVSPAVAAALEADAADVARFEGLSPGTG
jgi:hypothetical protein